MLDKVVPLQLLEGRKSEIDYSKQILEQTLSPQKHQSTYISKVKKQHLKSLTRSLCDVAALTVAICFICTCINCYIHPAMHYYVCMCCPFEPLQDDDLMVCQLSTPHSNIPELNRILLVYYAVIMCACVYVCYSEMYGKLSSIKVRSVSAVKQIKRNKERRGMGLPMSHELNHQHAVKHVVTSQT